MSSQVHPPPPPPTRKYLITPMTVEGKVAIRSGVEGGAHLKHTV